jgi:hypothetical protein
MAMTQCHNGHIYDDRMHTHCPYCPVPGLRDAAIPATQPGPVTILPRITVPARSRFAAFRRSFGQAISSLKIEHPRGALHEDRGGTPRVFISSTFRDLELFRQAAFEAIQSLGGTGDNMVYWSADDAEPSELSISRVKSSDLMVLILAHRYGSIAKDSSYSITELEYRAAREYHVPVLAFIVDGRAPWAPDHIEWHQKEKLDRFKDIVRADVTTKSFSSVEELNRLITQAVSNFRDRNRDVLVKKGRLRSRAIRVSLPIKINTESSLAVPIGSSEDGLPLLLGIKRERDLRPHLDRLFEIINPEGGQSLSGLYDNVRQLLEEEALSHWAKDRVFQVRMRDGRQDEMYVTRSNLSKFGSLFARLLATISAPNGGLSPLVLPVTEPAPSASRAVPDRRHRIQSSGGRNRFIAVSLHDGRVYCAGQQLNGTEWEEWRPFLFEEIAHHFSDALYRWLPQSDTGCNVKSYPIEALDHFAESICENGEIQAEVTLRVPRATVARKIVEVAHALATLHERGQIHGDLKPQNILLTAPQISLIDELEISELDRAPAWTPFWSAPEQVIGSALSYSADVYPLGVMVSQLLEAELVGEVRDFLAPSRSKGTRRHHLLYNPTLYIRENTGVLAPEDVPRWVAFVAECLRFDPERRLSRASEFAERLLELIERHAPSGDVEIPASEMPLIAATLPDGSDTIARFIPDETLNGTASPWGAAASPEGRW